MAPRKDAKEKKARVPKKATTTPRAPRKSTRGGGARSRGSATQRAVTKNEESTVFKDDDGVMRDYSELLKYSGKNRPKPGSAPFEFPPVAQAASTAPQESIDIPMLDLPEILVQEEERLLPWKGPMKKDKTAAEWLAHVQQNKRLHIEKVEGNIAELDYFTSLGEEYEDEAWRLVEEQEVLNLELLDLELLHRRAYKGYERHQDSHWDNDI